MIKHIENEKEFDEIIKQGKVLVDFFANWCGPCKMLAPNLEALDADPSFAPQIVKVDVDENEDLAIRFNVQSIPSLFYFEDGKVKNQALGFMRKDQLVDFCK